MTTEYFLHVSNNFDKVLLSFSLQPLASLRKVCKRDYSCSRQVSSPNPEIVGEAMDVIHLDGEDTNNPNSVRVFVSLSLPQTWELGPEP